MMGSNVTEIISNYSSTPIPIIVSPIMEYILIFGVVIMLVCMSYLVVTKKHRKKSKTKPKEGFRSHMKGSDVDKDLK